MNTSKRIIGLGLSFAAMFSVTAMAQSSLVAPDGFEGALGQVTTPGDDCPGGIIQESGVFAGGRGNTASPTVQLFSGLVDVKITKVCAVLTSNNAPTNVDFDIVIFAPDGPGGAPGTELYRIAAPAAGAIPVFTDFEWFSAVTDFTHSSGDIYIGIDQFGTGGSPSDVFLGGDKTTPSTEGRYFIDPNWETEDTQGTYGVRLIVEEAEDNPANNRATFSVSKIFADGNDVDEVNVSIDCNTGLILDQDKMLADGESVEFVVTSFSDGELNCTITEDGETGYSAEYNNTSLAVINDESCEYTEVDGDDAFECVITNTPDPVKISITKDWVFEGTVAPDLDTFIAVEVGCSSEIVNFSCGILGPASGSSSENPANGYPYYATCNGPTGLNDVQMNVFVRPDFPDTKCTATEYWNDSSIESKNDCGTFSVSVGKGYSCTITNTVWYEGIPTLGQYGMALLALLMLGVGFVSFRRFS